MRHWNVRVYFEARDIWVGLYWDRSLVALHFYVCLLPCFPIHIWRMDDKPPFPGYGEEE